MEKWEMVKIYDKDGKPIKVDGQEDIPEDTMLAINPDTG